jgi:hypothetical protein
MEFRAFELTKRLKEKKAEYTKAMADVKESATSNYMALEQEHMKTYQKMKDAEEKARADAELKAKMEAEVIKLQGKVKLLKSDCIQSIGQAREKGKQEVRAEVTAQFQGVFN